MSAQCRQNVCTMSAQYPHNVGKMSALCPHNISRRIYVGTMSAQCPHNVGTMSALCPQNISRMIYVGTMSAQCRHNVRTISLFGFQHRRLQPLQPLHYCSRQLEPPISINSIVPCNNFFMIMAADLAGGNTIHTKRINT